MGSGIVTVGAILAGGSSRRFGTRKALAEWRDRPLIEWVIEAHRVATTEFCIVANDAAAFARFGAPIVADRYPGRGPAAGIHAALEWAGTRGASGIWCTPCDAPLVSPDLAGKLIAAARGADAVLPRSDGPLGYEPLFGWYAVTAAGEFASALESGIGAMHEIVPRLGRVVYLPADPVPLGNPDRAFRNINTPADLLALARDLDEPVRNEG